MTAKAKTARKSTKPAPKKPVEPPRKLSQLDAAAAVLATADGPMSCPELVAAMAAKKLWASPAGKTPHATLYAAITYLPLRGGGFCYLAGLLGSPVRVQ